MQHGTRHTHTYGAIRQLVAVCRAIRVGGAVINGALLSNARAVTRRAGAAGAAGAAGSAGVAADFDTPAVCAFALVLVAIAVMRVAVALIACALAVVRILFANLVGPRKHSIRSVGDAVSALVAPLPPLQHRNTYCKQNGRA